MGFLDRLIDRIQDTVKNKILDKAGDKAGEAADMALDSNTYKKKGKSEDVEYSDKRKCPSCGTITECKFCDNCGKDLSKVKFLTVKQLEEAE